MNERNLEELSALVDGETSELDVRRVLKNIEQDQALSQKWARYQLASAVLKGETHGRATQWQQVDLSARIALALENEPAHGGIVAAPAKRAVTNVLLKPFANVAVAASVSAAVILGRQNLQPQSVAGSAPMAAAPVSSGTVVASAPMNSGSGLMQVAQTGAGYRPATVVNAPEIIRYNPDVDDRLNDYLISHSGNAAFNTASGMAPYARVVTLKPASQATPNSSAK